MRKTPNYFIAVAFIMLGFTLMGQEDKKASVPKTIDSITLKYPKSTGFIDTYFLDKDNSLMWAIPDSILGRDLLMVSRFVQLPSDYSGYTNAGSKTAERVVRFEKKANSLVLREQSFVNTAQESDPISESVQANNFAPILAVFDIKNEGQNTSLIDVTDYFSADSPGFNIISEGNKKKYKIGAQDKKRSFIDRCRSFPQNVEVRHTLTYKVDEAPRGNRSGTFSFQINHSLVLLPKEPMQMRLVDHRVGWFSLKKYDYSSPALKSDDFEVAVRWRLEPKDVAAYQRGELVAPIKPIVFYLDPATPMQWRPYFKQGIEDWQETFESAGFKNAIIAKDPPSLEEDPDFSPEDVRYSTVRYVASTTRNAVGPSVKDPRSGEILESDVIWYHNHLRSYRNRYLLETGAANPKARTLDTPEEEIGEMMRRVIAHEVGHALGLPHNMKASSAYAVDSLRSGDFTQKMGIATTIMVYARYNYVAQPGDQNIRFVRQIGPYDHYAIEWGYRYFDGADIAGVDQKLKTMVDAKSLDPLYMFGGRGNDPMAQTENIGDDPIKATEYGLKNLKIVAENLEAWTTQTGGTYDDLEELYGELLGVYRRYVTHVAEMIGGVYQTRINQGQKAIPYQNVPEHKQLAALDLLTQELWRSPNWLMTPDMISKFSNEGALERVSQMQRGVLSRILDAKKLNEMYSTSVTLAGKSLPISTLLEVLQADLLALSADAPLHRNLQVHFVEQLMDLLKDKDLASGMKGMIQDALDTTQSVAKSRRNKGSELQRNHYRYVHELLENDKGI